MIDVSTDGQSGSGPTEAQNAIDGVGLSNIAFDQVNCLGVGSGARCGFVPDGSFSIAADDFNAFQDALERKIGTELGTGPNNPVPAPPVVWLFGAGVLMVFGAGAARTRRSAVI